MHICGVETFCVFGLIIHFNAHGIFHRSTSSEDETECQWIEMLCARACFTVNYMQCRARSARPANTHTQNRFSINRQCSSWALFPFYVMLRYRARWLTQIYIFFLSGPSRSRNDTTLLFYLPPARRSTLATMQCR